jgi:hypothetical protein
MLGVDATGYVSSYPGVDLAVMEADKTGDEAHERLVLHQKDHWTSGAVSRARERATAALVPI